MKFERRDWLRLLAVGILLMAAFAFTVKIRASTYNRFGLPGDNLWRILHNDALVATRNWYLKGPLEAGFLINLKPHSIENPETAPIHYVSYPALFVALPWAIARISGTYPDLALLMDLSLATHLLVALLLAFLLYRFLRSYGLEPDAAAAFSLLSGLLVLGFRGTLFFFQNGWWADMAVLPLFLAMVLVDQGSEAHSRRPWYRCLTAGLVLLGCFADWLFYCLLAVIFARRITSAAERRYWPELLVPAAVQLVFHGYLTLQAKMAEPLLEKFLERSALGESDRSVGFAGWHSTLEQGFGEPGRLLYYLSVLLLPLLLFLFFRRATMAPGPRRLVELTVLLIVPVHLHFLLVRQHYFEHSYEALKVALPLAAVPFALVPAALWGRLRRSWQRLALIVLAWAGGLHLLSGFQELYANGLDPGFNMPHEAQRICEILSARPYEEVIFSSEFASDVSLRRYSEEEEGKVLRDQNGACFKSVYLAFEPEEVELTSKMYNWPIAMRTVKPRFRLLTRSAPENRWVPYLLSGEGEPVGEGYFLYSLNPVLAGFPPAGEN